jgi:hypothetical protein
MRLPPGRRHSAWDAETCGKQFRFMEPVLRCRVCLSYRQAGIPLQSVGSEELEA